ncbi:diguanylate cyclase (GGDEF)-like protein [Geodermatophilus bullaregiensis]|uniref:GGDEF domain-containing protein n=1 Tax=Geodermatophilus bullaregiensis TaxID=1564160 RepID=UPI001957F048|nr:GGDEF domain-containing protein [Geodermatophilus bullaregiensis]MBM7804224.1 diguanylate cyclase (GGDEF)-like protein [Geodermatophilus bullaregiensis]
MDTPAAVRARDPAAAAHSSTLILSVSAAVVAGFGLVVPDGTGAVVLVAHAVVVVALPAGAGRAVTTERYDRLHLGLLTAVGGVAMVCGLDLVTRDASAAAQAFVLPVLWAGSRLRPAGIVLATTAAVGGEAVTLLVLTPPAVAVVDLATFAAVLVVLAVVLVRAGRVQQRLVDALSQQARIDALTGLVNRRVFDEAPAGARTRRTASGTALLLTDVDTLEQINDAHGHPVGDAVLVHLARILREQVRSEDAVVSRLGGDELAVLLPDCPAAVAATRAERVHEAVRSTPLALADGTLLSLSISLGLAHTAGQAADVEELYSAADRALYEAKRAGRGRVAVATAGLPRQAAGLPRQAAGPGQGVRHRTPAVG